MIFALLTSLAFAQDEANLDYSVDIERFRPAQDTYGYAVTESAATLQHLQLGVGLWGNYSEDSVVLVWQGERVLGDGQEDGDGIIDNRSVADLQVGLGLSKYFSFTADLPVVMWQSGFEPASADTPGSNSELIASGPMDLRLSPKFVLVNLDDGPVGLALIPQISIPLGADRSFMGEHSVTALPLAVFELADGPVNSREYRVRFALNAGFHVRDPARFRDLLLRNEVVYRAAIAVHPTAPVEFGVDVAGAAGGSRSAQIPLEVLPWLKLIPLETVTITAGGGIGVLPGVGTPDFRVFGGATLSPSFDPSNRDSDRDGIYNDVDQCRYDPEDFDKFEDEDGCPEADNDKDGMLDGDDACPNLAEDFDNFQDDDGCPEADNDLDKILDGDDDCPDEPETYNEFADTDGCPDEKPVGDTDGDGYKDDVDRCPYDPEDFDQFEDEDGCPELDNDRDTIPDTVDRCRNVPENFNGVEDEDGCPDSDTPSRVVVERERIRILDRIEFDYNRATIRPESFGLMDEIATVMLDHPELKFIRVEGHTDSDGNDGYNLKLSQARAESVVNYLVAAGLDRSRLDPVGFGETRPIEANDSDAHKQVNRRVEFLIVEQD